MIVYAVSRQGPGGVIWYSIRQPPFSQSGEKVGICTRKSFCKGTDVTTSAHVVEETKRMLLRCHGDLN